MPDSNKVQEIRRLDSIDREKVKRASNGKKGNQNTGENPARNYGYRHAGPYHLL
jgi:hypothetical protein